MAKRRCIFCGGTPLSREHVFGDEWIKSIFGDRSYTLFRGSSVGSAVPTKVQDWQASGPDLVIKCACRDCNHGWMERLNKAAHPLMEPLVHGHLTVIARPRNVEVVAAWAAKVGMCLASVTTKRRLPTQDEADCLRFTGLPPTNYRIRLAQAQRFTPEAWTTTIQLLPKADIDPAGNEGFVTTFRVNHLVFQVFRPPPERLHAKGAGSWDRLATAIWPTVEPVYWSHTAKDALDGLGVYNFARAYHEVSVVTPGFPGDGLFL